MEKKMFIASLTAAKTERRKRKWAVLIEEGIP